MNIDATGKSACCELGRFFILYFSYYLVLADSFKTNSLIV